jgi:hypothetical protein
MWQANYVSTTYGSFESLRLRASPGKIHAPGVLSYPIVVGAGDSIDVAVRFQPSTFGPKAGAITIFSDDPAGIHTVHVFGMAPAPKANLTIAKQREFWKGVRGFLLG